MRKEILIAVIIGLFAGLFVTYGLYRFRSRSSSSTTPTAIPIPSQQPDENQQTTLVVDVPFEGMIQKDSKITVSGTTTTKATIVITTQDEYYFTSADETGNFAQEIVLINGVNDIGVHAYDEAGAQTTVSRTVVRMDPNEPLKEASPSAQPTASASARPAPRATPKPSPTATP